MVLKSKPWTCLWRIKYNCKFIKHSHCLRQYRSSLICYKIQRLVAYHLQLFFLSFVRNKDSLYTQILAIFFCSNKILRCIILKPTAWLAETRTTLIGNLFVFISKIIMNNILRELSSRLPALLQIFCKSSRRGTVAVALPLTSVSVSLVKVSFFRTVKSTSV